MSTLVLDKAEQEAIVLALGMRIAYIETGDPVLRARDVEPCGKGRVNALDTNQMRTIIVMEDLMKRILNL